MGPWVIEGAHLGQKDHMEEAQGRRNSKSSRSVARAWGEELRGSVVCGSRATIG